jgi:Flp pilus assembly pilin Flp
MVMRAGQTTTEYMMTISVITIAIIAVIRLLLGTLYYETDRLANSMATSLTTDGIQEPTVTAP